MNKLTTLIACAMLTSTLATQAIPADPRPRTVQLADGSSITVCIVGDEHGSWAVAEDGKALLYDNNKRAYKYINDAELNAVKAQRSAHMAKYALTPSTKSKGMRKAQAGQKCNDYPTIGKRHSLVLLVEFKDKKFESVSDPKEYYTRHLNEEGFSDYGATGSVRDFYLAASNGLFEPIYDVVGPIQLPENTAYYGDDESASSDAHVGRICYDAATIAAEQGLVDFSKYDLDENGMVDNIFIYYAGYGQADSGIKDCVWPHSTDLSKLEDFPPLIFDGKQIGSYACSNEVRYDQDETKKEPTGIGTCVHEFGHTLGLPDLYTTIYNPFVHHPNKWSTMASGSYNNDMNTPPTLSSYERFSLDWIVPTELNDHTYDNFTLKPLTISPEAYLVQSPSKEDEYFLYENRQKESWDEYLPGHGMLVWHIDYDEEKWLKNNVNNDYTHQNIDVVEADGIADTSTFTGDTFPGTGNVTEMLLTDWSGNEIAESPCFVKEYFDNEEECKMIELHMMRATFPVDSPSLKINSTDAHSVALSWEPVLAVTSYQIAISGADGSYEATEVLNADATSHTFANLPAATSFTVTLIANVGYVESKPASVEFATSALPFDERKPQGVAADGITASGFTASWDALEGAENYTVNIYAKAYSTETETMGYDFAAKAEGMPQGWESSSSTYYSVSGYYGAGSPSLRMSSDGDYLVISYPERLITTLSFWNRTQKSQGTLAIQIVDEDGNWVDYETLALSADANTATFAFSQAQSKVRLLYHRDGGYVCIDDVATDCLTLERIPVSAAIAYQGCTATVSGLKPATLYAFTVTATDAQGTSSLASAEVDVTTLDGESEPTTKDATPKFAYAYSADSSIGFGEPYTYNVAIALDNDSEITKFIDIESKKVESVFIYPLEYTNISNVKVWVSSKLPTTTDGEYLSCAEVDAATLIPNEWNEVRLSQPTADAKFAGYSFTISAIGNDCDANAVPLATTNLQRIAGTAYIAEQSNGRLQWMDYADMFGSVVLGVRLNGEFQKYALLAIDADDVRAVAETEANADATFLNLGVEPISTIDYDIDCDGTMLHGECELASPTEVGLLEPIAVNLPFEAPAYASRSSATLLPTLVNGYPCAKSSSCQFGITTLTEAIAQRVVEEEFTGTTCGNCPRGIKGMEITESKYPEAVLIAIHRYQVTDPMYIDYPYSAAGYPGCYINRTSKEIDPYYGKPLSESSADDTYGLDAYFQSPNPLADAGISLEAEWIDNTIAVNATTTVATDLDGKYRLEFVVLADDLYGDAKSWCQTNYFSGSTYYENHPDLAEYVTAPYYIDDIRYNHVAAQWYGGSDKYVLESLYAGAENQLSTTLDMSVCRFISNPGSSSFDKEKTSLAALLIKDDGTTKGEIVNATKVALGGGIEGIESIEIQRQESDAAYDLLGRPVSEGYKGFVIKNGNAVLMR